MSSSCHWATQCSLREEQKRRNRNALNIDYNIVLCHLVFCISYCCIMPVSKLYKCVDSVSVRTKKNIDLDPPIIEGSSKLHLLCKWMQC